MKKQKLDRRLKLVIQGLPLAAVVGSSLLTVQRSGQQILVLITLLWIQVFFLVECFVARK
jgi:fatty acid desaturase